MKKIIFLLLLVFSFLLGFNIVLADNEEIEVKIKMADSFEKGEKISFEYEIKSLTSQTIKFFPFIDCPQIPSPMYKFEEIELNPNDVHMNVYGNVKVEESFEPQTCQAQINIVEPFEKAFSREFKIEADPSFSILLHTCRDQACLENAKVFYVNETIWLSMETEIKDLAYSASLLNPSGKETPIILPYSFVPDVEGTYKIVVNAKKDGYKNRTIMSEFAIIEGMAQIKNISQCQVDGKCQGEENVQNCPQDCVEVLEQVDQSKSLSPRIILLSLVGLLIIVFIGTAYYFLVKKNQDNL